LSQYKEAMLDMEYDDIDVIQRFTPGEMDEMLTHIQAKPGARKKFKFAIEDLQKHASAAQLSQPTTPSIMSPPITPPADGAFPWGEHSCSFVFVRNWFAIVRCAYMN
jgi:hypothetical protein